jgi:ammonia channel protein AmtB
VFVVFVAAWVGATTLALFLGLKHTLGVRVSVDVEKAGMDDSKHGGSDELRKEAAKAESKVGYAERAKVTASEA